MVNTLLSPVFETFRRDRLQWADQIKHLRSSSLVEGLRSNEDFLEFESTLLQIRESLKQFYQTHKSSNPDHCIWERIKTVAEAIRAVKKEMRKTTGQNRFVFKMSLTMLEAQIGCLAVANPRSEQRLGERLDMMQDVYHYIQLKRRYYNEIEEATPSKKNRDYFIRLWNMMTITIEGCGCWQCNIGFRDD